jgi:hypothetical protein
MITIANAVIAGLNISDRLTALEVSYDEQLAENIAALASEMAGIMVMAEKIDQAMALISKDALSGDEDRMMQGIAAVKGVTEMLVSGQDALNEKLYGGLTEEEFLMQQLLQSIGSMR